MIRFISDGRYELCWSRPGNVRLYRFRPGQEAAIAQCIADDHCRGKLPKHAALLLLGAVINIVQRRVKPPSFAERVRLAIRRLIGSGLQRAFGSECSGK